MRTSASDRAPGRSSSPAPSRRADLAGRGVARIGLGTNRLTDTGENRDFLRSAVDAGVELIDTAHLYTGGESERAIGNALAPLPADLVVASKAGYRPGDGRPERLRAQVKESLERLRVETIPLYYLHRVDPEIEIEESVGALAELRDAGRIERVGLSEVSVEQIERARRVVPIAAVQNEYNLAERKHDEVVDHCAREGILFVPFYPLHGAELATEWAARHGATAGQIALAWLLRRSPAIAPIPGTLSIEHLRENLAAHEIELGDQEFRELTALA